jgi:AcrR family transcriptional regulator
MPPSPATASNKRDHLLATAWRLFYRDGYHRVGIDTILAEAQVAKMTLYNHFTSKDELIVTLLDERNASIIASLDRTIADAGPKPAARFAAVFDWLAEWFASKDFRGCAFIRALAEFPDRDHPVHQAAWRFKLAFHSRLVDLAREHGVRKPTALADALSLLIDGAIITAHGAGPSPVAQTAKTTAITLLDTAPRTSSPAFRAKA